MNEPATVTLTSAVSSIIDLIGDVMTTISGSSVLMAMFCVPIIYVAVRIVRKLRSRY